MSIHISECHQQSTVNTRDQNTDGNGDLARPVEHRESQVHEWQAWEQHIAQTSSAAPGGSRDNVLEDHLSHSSAHGIKRPSGLNSSLKENGNHQLVDRRPQSTTTSAEKAPERRIPLATLEVCDVLGTETRVSRQSPPPVASGSGSGSWTSSLNSASATANSKQQTGRKSRPPTPGISAKRRRAFKTQSAHWERDGNVLVQAQDVRFKLHLSQLAKLSSWFRDVDQKRSAARERNDSDTRDEVIFLDELNVIAEDFEALLEALDRSITYLYDPPSFHMVASILRASTALSFHDYAVWAKRHIESQWPSSLSNVSRASKPFALETVLLSRQFNILPVLKPALYEIVRAEGFAVDGSQTAAAQCCLSLEDYKVLVKVRERLAMMWASISATPSEALDKCPLADKPKLRIKKEISFPPSRIKSESTSSASVQGSCTTVNSDHVQRSHAKLVHTGGIFKKYIWDPICGVQELIEAPWKEEGFCSSCVGAMKLEWGRERQIVWEELDKLFGIQD